MLSDIQINFRLDFQNHTQVVFTEKCLCSRLSGKILLNAALCKNIEYFWDNQLKRYYYFLHLTKWRQMDFISNLHQYFSCRFMQKN